MPQVPPSPNTEYTHDLVESYLKQLAAKFFKPLTGTRHDMEQLAYWQDELVDRGFDPVATFLYQGVAIRNPFEDESGASVDPLEYYPAADLVHWVLTLFREEEL